MEGQVQGTEEWFDLKRGKISSTHMADILMKNTTAGYRNYMAKLVLERITGKTEETFCSYDMAIGIEREPDARACYAFETNHVVDQVAWIDHPTISMAGASPDGVIYAENGGIEIKSPKAATHLDYILTEKIDRNYVLQMQWAMSCQPKIRWINFVSYHPDFPLEMQLKIIRVERDDKQISELESAAVKFNLAVDRMIQDLKAAF